MLQKIFSWLYSNPVMEKIIPTQIYLLRKELAGCQTVLDLGCGPSSPIQYCGPFKHSVGVEVFEPYLKESRAKGIHQEYLLSHIEDLDFEENSFDAVALIEVIEHMEEEKAAKVLELAEKWARKKVVVTSPNGFVPQKALDGNQYQEHLSGWPLNKMKQLGYRSYGLARFKFLRQEVEAETMGDDVFSSIRLRPRFFWFLVAALSQILTYRMPGWAFELLSIKSVSGSNR